MPESSFEKTKLESMVGEERTKTIKPGDMVVFTSVMYNEDDNQDWLHSLVSPRLYCVAARAISKYQDSVSPNGWCG